MERPADISQTERFLRPRVVAGPGGPPRLTTEKARALAFTSLGHFINDGSSVFIPLIVDLLSALKGITPLEVSILLFLFPFSSTLTSVLVGRLAEKTGKPAALMALGIGCMGLGLTGFYLAMVLSTGVVLFASAFLCVLAMGVGSSFYHPLGGSILQSAFSEGGTGRALGLNGAMGSVGRALYPSLFYVAAAAFNKPGSLGFFGLVGFGSALLIWTGMGKAEARKPPAENPKAPSVRRSLSKPMAVLMGVSFLRSMSLFGVISYIPVFLTTQRNLGIESTLGLSLTAFYASAVVGQPFFGLLTERFDHRAVLAASAVGAAGSLVAYVYSEGALGVVFLTLFGFFAFTGFPLLLSLAADYSEVNASALGNSLVWGLGATGGNSVGPLLIYALTLNDYGKLGSAFEVMAALAVVSAVGALLIPKPAPRT